VREKVNPDTDVEEYDEELMDEVAEPEVIDDHEVVETPEEIKPGKPKG